MNTVWTPLDQVERALGLHVLVIGDVPELASIPLDFPARRIAPERVPSEPVWSVLLVLDAATHDVDTLRRVRADRRFTNVPVVLFCERDDWVAAVIDADDVVRRPSQKDELAHRLGLLVELGRARFKVAFAERALAESRGEAGFLSELLAERETFDHAILDGVDVGIVTTDANGHVTFMNRAAADVLQLDCLPAGGEVHELLGLDGRPEELLGREPRRTISYTMASHGAELEIELSVSRAEGAAHERVGYFFIFRDLTEEKQREEEHRRFERLAAMGTMVAGFAHEVRNPVASLRALAETLNEELVEQGLAYPHVKRMLGVLDRVERLVRTSLQFGRPTAPKRAKHRPWALLSQAATEVAPRTTTLGGELRLEVEPDLPHLYVDDGQIVQVLVILLNNALDATGSSRRVQMRAIRSKTLEGEHRRGSFPPPPPNRVRLEVSDDGPGIPPDVAARIFDPFFTTKPTGTGLGLSIAQQIVSENGARLEVSSSRGGPTTFAVVITPDDVERTD